MTDSLTCQLAAILLQFYHLASSKPVAHNKLTLELKFEGQGLNATWFTLVLLDAQAPTMSQSTTNISCLALIEPGI